jgi:Vitamin K-dependent gamma-carboxylase
MFRRSAHSQPPPSPVKDEESNDKLRQDSEDEEVDKDVIPKVSIASMTPQQRQELFRQGLWQIAYKRILMPVFDFFHARTGPKGCRVSGWIRFCYAFVFVYSRTLFAMETDFLLDPLYGVLPYRVTQVDMEDYEWSIFQWAPESRPLVYAVVYSSLVAGWGLLLGIQPRACALWIFVTSHMLNNHNGILWDSEDNMFRLWDFFLLFMPLDHITVYDQFGGWCPWIKDLSCFNGSLQQRIFAAVSRAGIIQKCPVSIRQRFHRRAATLPVSSQQTDIESGTTSTSNQQPLSSVEQSASWPMWPFRLFQIYMCIIYLGAGLCKLNTAPWQNGTALWWLWYDGSFGRFFPGWVSEYFFNRMAIVKLQTWIALVIECSCMFTIWVPSLRWYTFLAVIALHIGIELALIMHAFEYLSVIGWISFFIYPNDTLKKDSTKTTGAAKSDTSSVPSVNGVMKTSSKSDKGKLLARILAPSNRKILLESVLVGVLLFFFTVDSIPRNDVLKVLPSGVGSMVKSFVFPTKETRKLSLQWGERFGIHAGQWTVYRNIPPHSDYTLTAVIQYKNGTAPSVWHEPDFYARTDLKSLYMRERYYWSSNYFYYLSKEYVGNNEAIPFLATFAVYLARVYGDGYIRLKARRKGAPHMIIDPNSQIKSISIMAHRATGKKFPKNVGLWESVPRGWEYNSDCNYVLTFDDLAKEFDVSDLYEYNKKESFDIESGCNELEEEDEKLHLQYGSFEGHKSIHPLYPHIR